MRTRRTRSAGICEAKSAIKNSKGECLRYETACGIMTP